MPGEAFRFRSPFTGAERRDINGKTHIVRLP